MLKVAIRHRLSERLGALGYDGHTRSFTPAQVRLIVEALGEP